ncbi:hypothetical protein AB9X52_19095 [Enterobacter hormaechei]|uniref:hypothetical protein n=1 Tax=Enterobacter hormaechei TaxID=158836 RepID=UPI00321E4B0B
MAIPAYLWLKDDGGNPCSPFQKEDSITFTLSQTLKTKEIPHRADHHPCVLFPVAFTTTNLNSNT